MDERFRIPRTLDAPYLFLFVEADTAAVFMGVFIMMALFNVFLSIPLAWLIVRLYIRHKSRGTRGLLFHVAYWYTPSSYWLSTLANSSRREYWGQ
ncbi:MAG: type IV conjugative transfer system protein TraL [Pseudomonadales bacterium]|nr:type IV conjugative transfer system protein TraL [Pseudomonadales bacterium]